MIGQPEAPFPTGRSFSVYSGQNLFSLTLFSCCDKIKILFAELAEKRYFVPAATDRDRTLLLLMTEYFSGRLRGYDGFPMAAR